MVSPVDADADCPCTGSAASNEATIRRVDGKRRNLKRMISFRFGASITPTARKGILGTDPPLRVSNIRGRGTSVVWWRWVQRTPVLDERLNHSFKRRLS